MGPITYVRSGPRSSKHLVVYESILMMEYIQDLKVDSLFVP